MRQLTKGIEQLTETTDATIFDLAESVCNVVEKHYGNHNYERFITIVKARLK